MLPVIAELEFEEILDEQDLPQQGKSFLFDFGTGDFVLRDGKLVEISEKQALQQWINKTIRTARLRFEVYKDNPEYGVSIDDLIGSNYPIDFVEKEIENELKETLLQNEQIISLSNFNAEKNESTLTVKFMVNSIFDDFEQEVVF